MAAFAGMARRANSDNSGTKPIIHIEKEEEDTVKLRAILSKHGLPHIEQLMLHICKIINVFDATVNMHQGWIQIFSGGRVLSALLGLNEMSNGSTADSPKFNIQSMAEMNDDLTITFSVVLTSNWYIERSKRRVDFSVQAPVDATTFVDRVLKLSPAYPCIAAIAKYYLFCNTADMKLKNIRAKITEGMKVNLSCTCPSGVAYRFVLDLGVEDVFAVLKYAGTQDSPSENTQVETMLKTVQDFAQFLDSYTKQSTLKSRLQDVEALVDSLGERFHFGKVDKNSWKSVSTVNTRGPYVALDSSSRGLPTKSILTK